MRLVIKKMSDYEERKIEQFAPQYTSRAANQPIPYLEFLAAQTRAQKRCDDLMRDFSKKSNMEYEKMAQDFENKLKDREDVISSQSMVIADLKNALQYQLKLFALQGKELTGLKTFAKGLEEVVRALGGPILPGNEIYEE